MADVQEIRALLGRRGIGEVPVCDMESMPLALHGVDGRRYAEVEGNVWMAPDRDDVAYVGTSRHGGHMTLRPLFVKVDGAWVNTMTGRPVESANWELSAV